MKIAKIQYDYFDIAEFEILDNEKIREISIRKSWKRRFKDEQAMGIRYPKGTLLSPFNIAANATPAQKLRHTFMLIAATYGRKYINIEWPEDNFKVPSVIELRARQDEYWGKRK